MGEKLDLRILLAGAAVSIAVSDAAAAEIASAPSEAARLKAFNALLETGEISAEPKGGGGVAKQFEREGGFAKDGNTPPDRGSADSSSLNAARMSERVNQSTVDTLQDQIDPENEFDREGGGGVEPADPSGETAFERDGGAERDGGVEPADRGNETRFEREAGFDRRG